MSLKYLVTILYRPRETMRRILDSGDRWTVQIVVLAFVCGSVNDIDARHLRDVIPDLPLVPGLALIALSLIVGPITWLIALAIVSAIATQVGRMFGGTAKYAEVGAALAWGLTPVVYSIVYRIPFTILASRIHVSPNETSRQVLLNTLAHGGCSMVLIYLALQLVFALASIILGSFTLAEAERFSTEKGFITVMISIALPLMILFAAIFSFRS